MSNTRNELGVEEGLDNFQPIMYALAFLARLLDLHVIYHTSLLEKSFRNLPLNYVIELYRDS